LCREIEDEGRSSAGGRFDGNFAFMLIDDGMHDGKGKACPLIAAPFLGGKIGIKDLVKMLYRNPLPFIRQGNFHIFAGIQPDHLVFNQFLVDHTYADRAAGRHRLFGVLHQGDNHLADLFLVHGDYPEILGNLETALYLVAAGEDQAGSLPDQRRQRLGGLDRFRVTCEIEEF